MPCNVHIPQGFGNMVATRILVCLNALPNSFVDHTFFSFLVNVIVLFLNSTSPRLPARMAEWLQIVMTVTMDAQKVMHKHKYRWTC